MNNHTSKNIIILVLIITIIIDIMGLGLLCPIIPSLFFDSTEATTFGQFGGSFQSWYYSIALACWPLGLVIGCPILGELSDKYGRKIILIIALSITGLGYIISAYAVYYNNYILFITSRFISGLASSSFEIAQASVIDISIEEDQSKNLGYIAMAASLGFVLGPIITSFLSFFDIGQLAPFIFASFLSFLNATFILFFLKKDLPTNPALIINVATVCKAILFLLLDKRIKLMGIAYLLVQAAWGFYAQGAALFLDQVYNYNVTRIGMFYGTTGLSFAICSLFIQPIIFNFLSIVKSFIIFTMICGLCLISTVIFSNISIYWIIGIVVSAAQLICYTSLLSTISSAVSHKEQGKAMGAAGAGFGLAWLINDIMMGYLASKSVYAPIPFGGMLYFISIFVFIIAIKQLNTK